MGKSTKVTLKLVPKPLPAMSENDIQSAVAKLLDLAGVDWWHTPNESKRSPKYGGILKSRGLKAGIPDIIITQRSVQAFDNVAIELKRDKKSPLSDDQGKWLKILADNGWCCHVCYGLDDALEVLKWHGYISANAGTK